MYNLFTGSGVGPCILYLAISIFLGLLLGKIKIANISLGITWVLFVGIIISALGVTLNHAMLHIIKEFGLILFVTAVGLQVGPTFFNSFKKGGLAMNLMALANVALGVVITYIIAKVANESLTDMAGVYTGAITNTPGLSARCKDDGRTVTVRASDGRIYIVRDVIDPTSRDREVVVSRMGAPEEIIGRYSSKERGSRINRNPISIALAKERILAERWVE